MFEYSESLGVFKFNIKYWIPYMNFNVDWFEFTYEVEFINAAITSSYTSSWYADHDFKVNMKHERHGVVFQLR